MKFTKLGNSDLTVSRICMGCMGFGDAGNGQHSWTLDEEHSREIIKHGLELGVNFFDTAIGYQGGTSEQYVGRALRDYAKREDVVVATKFLPRTPEDISADITEQQHIEHMINKSLENLGMDYVDLYLLHQPMGDYMGAWHAMEELYRDGVIRAIGVCNFYPHVLTDFCETAEIMPAVNQVELHPFFQQADALAVMKEYDVIPEAWGPFAEGNHGIFTHPVLTSIGEKYGKTAAQVALRWNVQRGVVVIPKSVHKNRMEQNMDIGTLHLVMRIWQKFPNWMWDTVRLSTTMILNSLKCCII